MSNYILTTRRGIEIFNGEQTLEFLDKAVGFLKEKIDKKASIIFVGTQPAAKDLVKALETVLANAKQSGLDSEKITFKKIEIDESIVMKRFHAGTRGRVKPYKRRMSHIKIVLSDELASKKQESRVKSLESSKKIEESKKEKGAKV